MSNGNSDNPFATPESAGPRTPEWQGTPVPPPSAAPVPPPPAPPVPPLAPRADYAQAPPPPGAYVSPEATAYPAAPKPYGAHFPPDIAAPGGQGAPSHSAVSAVASAPSQPIAPPPITVPPPPGAPQYAHPNAVAYPPPPPGYGYGYAPVYTNGSDAKNWMGIASLVLSLTTLALGFTCILGVIFGHMGVAAAKRGEANNKGLALAGLIIGWVFIGLWLLFFGLIALAIAMDDTSTY